MSLEDLDKSHQRKQKLLNAPFGGSIFEVPESSKAPGVRAAQRTDTHTNGIGSSKAAQSTTARVPSGVPQRSSSSKKVSASTTSNQPNIEKPSNFAKGADQNTSNKETNSGAVSAAAATTAGVAASSTVGSAGKQESAAERTSLSAASPSLATSDAKPVSKAAQPVSNEAQTVSNTAQSATNEAQIVSTELGKDRADTQGARKSMDSAAFATPDETSRRPSFHAQTDSKVAEAADANAKELVESKTSDPLAPSHDVVPDAPTVPGGVESMATPQETLQPKELVQST